MNPLSSFENAHIEAGLQPDPDMPPRSDPTNPFETPRTRPTISDCHASTIHTRAVYTLRLELSAARREVARQQEVIDRQTRELCTIKTERNNASRQPRNMAEATKRAEVSEADNKRLSDALLAIQEVMRDFGWNAKEDRATFLRRKLSNIGEAFKASPDAETA